MTRSVRRTALLMVGILAGALPVAAGPPLLCHPFDIGSARSLPWDGRAGWSAGDPRYDLRHLVDDTTALLTPATPVIVRMETLRRAALYASQDGRIAAGLLASLMDRVREDERRGRADALASFDAGYFAATLRQIAELDGPQHARRAENVRGMAAGIDGYRLVTKSLSARRGDPAIEFAAALIAARHDRAAYLSHSAKARAGAARDELLRRNLKGLS